MKPRLTTEQIALAAVRAVTNVEGWCDNHSSLQNLDRTDGEVRPSQKFLAEFRRQLRRLEVK